MVFISKEQITPVLLFNVIKDAYTQYLKAFSPEAASSCSTSFFSIFQYHSEEGVYRAHTLLAYAELKSIEELIYLLQRLFISSSGWDKKRSLKPILLDLLIERLGAPDDPTFSQLTKDKKAQIYMSALSQFLNVELPSLPQPLPTQITLANAESRLKERGELKPQTINLIQTLDKTLLLNTETLDKIIRLNSTYLSHFAEGICVLGRANILNHYYFRALIDGQCVQHAQELTRAMKQLDNNHLLNQDNLNALIQHAQHAKGLVRAMTLLDNNHLLNQSSLDTLFQYVQYAEGLSHAMYCLHKNKLLNQDNLSALFQHAQEAEGISSILQLLGRTDLLNQPQFNLVISHAAVFGERAFREAGDGLPRCHIDEARFNEWIKLCEQHPDNPAAACQDIVANIHQAIGLAPEAVKRMSLL